jgi:phosphatidylinositol dimannoside acyltransferase
MDMQGLLNSRRAGAGALWLCQHIPPGFGYRLSRLIATRIAANQETQAVRAVRQNQWVVHGEKPSLSELDQNVLECWQAITRSFFDLFHNLNRPSRLQSLVAYTPEVEALVARTREARHGVVIAGVHLAGFDIVAQAAALQGLRATVLSLPETTDAVDWQHEFRRKAGMEILPANLANLRYSLNQLAAGRSLLTGIDRPMPELKHQPCFFGRPARLPTHHITLALKAKVPVVVLAAVWEPEGRYRVYSSGELELISYSDRNREILCNAERVLEAASELIRKAPNQWAITHPVWPQVTPP